MISRPIADNPYAYASNIRLQPVEHPTVSNRFAQPKTSAAANEGASAAPEQAPQNNSFAQAPKSASEGYAVAAPSIQPLPPPAPAPGSRIDVYA
jgi:hypothetical protein